VGVGLAAGAIIGSALASRPYYAYGSPYGYGYGYSPAFYGYRYGYSPLYSYSPGYTYYRGGPFWGFRRWHRWSRW
jgi:hypothetical protein